MRRRRTATHSTGPQLTDETGQPITFATPGEPTPDERKRYAQAVQQATTSAPLTPAQRVEVAAIVQRRREMFPHLYND
jgi:hypothetical protein